MPNASVTIGHRMSCGEPDAQEWASPVRRAGRGNGPAVTPAPRPGLTLRGVLVVAPTIAVLAVDDPRLVGVKPQADLYHPTRDRGQHAAGLRFAAAMHDGIVRKALERTAGNLRTIHASNA